MSDFENAPAIEDIADYIVWLNPNSEEFSAAVGALATRGCTWDIRDALEDIAMHFGSSDVPCRSALATGIFREFQKVDDAKDLTAIMFKQFGIYETLTYLSDQMTNYNWVASIDFTRFNSLELREAYCSAGVFGRDDIQRILVSYVDEKYLTPRTRWTKETFRAVRDAIDRETVKWARFRSLVKRQDPVIALFATRIPPAAIRDIHQLIYARD